MLRDLKELIENLCGMIFSSTFLFSISAIIIFLNSIKKNNNFFDIRKIFIDQFKIFNNSKSQLFLFYGVPMLLAIATVRVKHLDLEIVGNIVIVLSIIISMIFAMISVLTSFENKENLRQVQNETFNTLSFEAILCIMALLISFIVLFVEEIDNEYISFVISIAIYYLMYTITLNIFIVIKRLKKLFDNR